ncbi:MAG TPA: NAD-dependent epimerase/dehydratase family protein [Burkholderiaceae bacterium]|nr:NAD-dependent epimerase/dehydratase family protein [Burkholderiaceae bacterium]
MSESRILVIGANGQVGTELAETLVARHGAHAVVTADLAPQGRLPGVVHLALDVMDMKALSDAVARHRIGQIYLLAALLSASGEQHPAQTWYLNMGGLLNVLELARVQRIERVFWPSSIAVFGPATPSFMTPQHTVTDPTTVYGISKLAGERWCAWYHARHAVDVRSLRFPGLISWKARPGGGTTDYAIEIFHAALRKGHYTCYLEADQALPMMYMPDAMRAITELMEAPSAKITERGAYNVAGVSFTPREIAGAIGARISDFTMNCEPDFRQTIAASWPRSIDDALARRDWAWRPHFDLTAIVDDMLENLRQAQKVG